MRASRTLALLVATSVLSACPAQESTTSAVPAAPAEVQTLEVGGKRWERSGTTMALKAALADGALSIGAVTDIKEASEENLANLAALVTWFKSQNVDLIVVAGDSGMSRSGIEQTLGALAAADVAVFNIIGNRESRKDYQEAMAAVAAKHPNVFDLTVIRRVDTPAVDIVSMPGYFNASYIHADDGWAYSAEDVAQLGPIVAACDSPALLISHGGPKQEGEQAIDRTAEGSNVGDPALTELIKTHKIPFGVFGNIHEAGGRATDLAGNQVLAQGQPHASLYLNPGPADGVAWMMNDKSESLGMAAVMTVKDGKASYVVHRLGGKAKGK